jgi:hypothetical protein
MPRGDPAILQRSHDLDRGQRPEVAVEVAARGHRVDVGAEKDRPQRSLSAFAPTKDISGRIDAGLEPCRSHQLHYVFAAGDVGVGVRHTADPVDKCACCGSPVHAQRFDRLLQACGIDAHDGRDIPFGRCA